MPTAAAMLLPLFAASGAAALVYEVVWFQLLQLIVGSTAVSMAVLLAAFMGGMCGGSLLFAQMAPLSMHPLRAYAMLEGAVAVAALLVLALVPLVGGVYVAVVGYGMPGLLLRGFVAALCLAPPTLLMGATLPAAARWLTATPRGVTWIGWCYAANIAGGVVGCLVAGFYLLPRADVRVATMTGAAVNALVAVTAMVVAARAPARVAAAPSPPATPPSTRRRHAGRIYLAIALSGAAALGAEVIWTRLLSLMFGATVYAFSIILAVYLAGLGAGSAAGAAAARRLRDPRLALGAVQLAACGTLAWAGWLIAGVFPYWPINPSQAASAWVLFQLDLIRAALAVIPAALCWGASFPLALACVSAPDADAATPTGNLYAANTAGAILGASAASLLAVQWIGTDGSQRALIVISGVAAAIAILPFSARRPVPLWIAYAAGVVLLLTLSVRPVPALLLAYGRYVGVVITGPIQVLYAGEGVNASVAVTETADHVRNFHVSGKIEASNHPQDMPLQRMLGDLPALMHADPASILVVGFGAGVTAGSFVPYPEVRRIVVAEIEPLIPKVVSTHFRRENNAVMSDPRVHVVYDDARHYAATTGERFDVITSDPIHPWVKGSATLFTREYFDLLKARLNPGGIVTQWVPLYESDADAVRSELATFFEVFPDATVWANRQRGGGYDIVLLGARDARSIVVSRAQARLGDPAHARAAASLHEVGFASAVRLFGSYAGRATDLRRWLAGAEINRDRGLHLQYVAGMEADVYRGDAIYAAMLQYRRYPEDLFAGDAAVLGELRSLIR
jgi:spermidine synthase